MWELVDQTHTQLTEVSPGLFGQLDVSECCEAKIYLTRSRRRRISYQIAWSKVTVGTSLVTAAYYRSLVLAPCRTNEYLTSKAELAFNEVVTQLGDDGWLNHVSNSHIISIPMLVHQQAVNQIRTNGCIVPDEGDVQSPEGQSFLGML